MMNNNQPKNNISPLYFENSYLVRNFFEYHYKVPESVYQRARYLSQHRGSNDLGLVDALLRYNLLMDCGPKTLETLEAIKHRPWLAVVTGQQAGIMTGPLYSIYKAVTAINLARHWENMLGLPVVPVFWIASEDHDFQEVSWVNYINNDRKVVRYVLEQPGNTGQSIGSIPISEDMEHMLDTLYNRSLEGQYKKEAFGMLRNTLGQSKTMTEWYARIMALLFRDHGLVLLDPMDLELRKMSRDIFIQGIDNWENINSIVENTGKTIAEMGLKVQVNIPPHSTNLFYYDNGIRKPVAARGKEYITRDGCVYFGDREGLKEKVCRYPWLFSPNVVLRPVVQEKLLPTLAYVAGPGEISYYAQFRRVYHVFNMKMPIIYPRNRLILIDSHCKLIMNKYALSLKDISSIGLEDMIRRILEKRGFDRIRQRLDDISKGLNDQYDQLGQSIPFLEGREDIIRANFNKIRLEMEYLKGKLYYHFKKHNRELVRDFELLYNYIYPKDNDQDRELNIFTFITLYGRGIIDFLMDNLPLDQKYPQFFLVISEDKINKDGG
jgi:bacillithiol biosynthesis cysteine-adding enzyme BshC